MVIQSTITSEILECIEQLPKKRQLELLSNLRRELQPKRKIATAQMIKELSEEINKSIFKNHTQKRLDALAIR